MNFYFDDKTICYTGKELAPLRNYLNYGLLGNSIAAWAGACKIDFQHMVDGEDLRSQSSIASDEMLHFIIEIFDVQLAAGVVLQRLFAEMIISEIRRHSPTPLNFIRKGDDVFFENRKLNISIATRSINSVLIHVGVNIKNRGTPVPTCCLEDFNITPKVFAVNLMTALCTEWKDILEATYKVHALPHIRS